MATVGNIAIVLVLLAVFAAGVALFWIARQDDSRAGRLIGLLAIAGSAVAFVWLGGGHWL